MVVKVRAFFGATMEGKIEVSDNIEEIGDYISRNVDDIEFGDPEFDTSLMDFEYAIDL